MSAPPVVVAGGTGFIGRHVVRRLLAGGGRVLVISRRGKWPDADGEEAGLPPGVEILAADLADPDCVPAMRRRLQAASVAQAVSLAGMLMRPGEAVRSYRRLHLDGTRHLLSALAPEGGAASPPRAMRLVHVSTTGVLGPTGETPLAEDAVPRPRTPYEISKLEGERLALASRREGLEVVVIRPGLVYGPGDRHLLALARAIRRGLFIPMAGGRARWQPIYVADVARAIEAALRAPATEVDGRVFHVAGSERVTVAELAARLAARLGTRPRRASLPRPLALLLGAGIEAACRPLGIEPPLSRQRVRTLTEHRLYSIDRAREVLSFVPEVGLDEGLDRALAWYGRRGLL